MKGRSKNKDANSMKFVTYFVALGLCLLTMACDSGVDDTDIDIGDYENQLEAWNAQNMLDYQIEEDFFSPSRRQYTYLTVRNGVSESGSSGILGMSSISSVPELYAWIINMKNGDSNTSFGSFKVGYNTEYHYPNEIIKTGRNSTDRWHFTVMPLEEGGLDIDIGEYEAHLEGWNTQNMLDYQLKVMTSHGRYNYNSVKISANYNIKNGIPNRDIVSFYDDLKEATVLEIYALVKEEEERIRNAYNGTDRSYLHVQYNTEYHYPTQISLGISHRFGYYECWEFELTPEETE